MTIEEFRGHGHKIVDWISRYLETIRERRVLPQVRPGEIIDALPPQAPEQGEPFERIFADFENKILTASTAWNHPRFFSYFAISSTPPSILAEMVMAALNQNGLLWKSGPALTELEQVTLGWLRQWLGLPENFFGIIYDTASTSTLHALIAARQAVAPESRAKGSPQGLVVYTSEQAHSSVLKDALALGFGESQVRLIASDSEFRMRLDELERHLIADTSNGLIPCCVVPTIGATPAASVDPVKEVIALGRRFGAWVHVDAAYAGPVAILPERREFFEGWEEADSLVVNPHKWLLTNFDLSVFFTARPDILRDAIGTTPEYLRTTQDPRMLNYMDYSIPLGRRFRALKLWFAMRAYGREGAANLIRGHLADGQWLKQQVEADSRFEIAAPVHFSLVCFRLKSSDAANHQLMNTINDSGFAFLSHTVLGGQVALRFAIGNWQTTREDVAATWAKIQEIASTLT